MSSYQKIDMHQHSHKMSFEKDGTPAINPVTGEPSIADSDESLIYKTLEEMDKYNIEKGFISSSFENIYRWMEVAPDRFLPAPAVGEDPVEPSIDLIREEYRAGRIMAIGEIYAQYNGISPNDLRLDPYFVLAVELDVPVLIHCLGIGAFTPAFRAQYGNPMLLEDVLVKYPNLRLWVENAGWPFLSEMLSIMSMFPNVYADLSTISWMLLREGFHDYLKGLLRGGLNLCQRVKSELIFGEPIAKRLMFGSDQMAWPETIGMAVDTIESADFLTENQKRDIFYNNAKRFLRL